MITSRKEELKRLIAELGAGVKIGLISESLKEKNQFGELFDDIEDFQPEDLGDQVKIHFSRTQNKVSVTSEATNAKDEPLLEFDMMVNSDNGTGDVLEIARDSKGKKKHQVHLQLDEKDFDPFFDEQIHDSTKLQYSNVADKIESGKKKNQELNQHTDASKTVNILNLISQMQDKSSA